MNLKQAKALNLDGARYIEQKEWLSQAAERDV